MKIDPSKVNVAEADIEEYLHQNPDAIGVDEWIARQFKLPNGIIDLLGIKNGRMAVVEVKNVPANGDALAQLLDYCAGIDFIAGYFDTHSIRRVLPILVAPSFSNRVYSACDHSGVEAFQFDVHLQASFGEVRFTDEHIDHLMSQYYSIAKSEVFQVSKDKYGDRIPDDLMSTMSQPKQDADSKGEGDSEL